MSESAMVFPKPKDWPAANAGWDDLPACIRKSATEFHAFKNPGNPVSLKNAEVITRGFGAAGSWERVFAAFVS